MSDQILDMIMKAIGALIEWASKQMGEDTATVRGRVLARLAAPATDPTDELAKDIAEAIRKATGK